MAKQLLTIDTIDPDRDFVAINGKPFYLRGNDELSLTEISRIRRVAGKIAAQGADADVLEGMDDFVNSVLAIAIIGLPPELRDRLTPLQKFKIVQAFTGVISTGANGVTKESASPPTTDGSSPASVDSTGAASASG
jgi:hypothetical protein